MHLRPPHSFAAAGDRKVVIRIFGFALVLLPFIDARHPNPNGRPQCAEGVGDKQGRKTDGLASSMVWLRPIPAVAIGDSS